MVNVPASSLNEMKWRNLVQDGIDHGSDTGKSQKETRRGHEQPPARPFGNALVDGLTQRCSVEQQQHQSRASDREQKYEPRVRHRTNSMARCLCFFVNLHLLHLILRSRKQFELQ